MKSVTASPTQEALAGLVERVTFQNAENGFCVLRTKARGHRDLVTVVGHSATIAEVYNGDIGYVEDIDPDAAELAARFDGHLVTCGLWRTRHAGSGLRGDHP